MAGFLKAEIEPRPLVLRLSLAQHFLDIVSATDRAADNAVRPAHLLDVLKTLLLSGELYSNLPDIHGLRMDSLFMYSYYTSELLCQVNIPAFLSIDM